MTTVANQAKTPPQGTKAPEKELPLAPSARTVESDRGDSSCGAVVASPSLAGRADGRPGPGLLPIGEVARRAGFTIKALRFYERRGLLPPSGRSPGGYRLYSEADLHRLEFIRQAKTLGLSLDQIRELVVTARNQTCSMARPRLLHVLDERIRQSARQIETLSRLKKDLERRRRALTRRPSSDHARGYSPASKGRRASR